MEKFRISTKKSLFEPIALELETDKGIKVYKIEMLKNELIEKLEKVTDEGGNKVAVLSEQLKLIFGVPKKDTMQIDIRDLNKLFDWLGEKVFDRSKDKEKNVSRVEQTQSKQ